MKKQSLDNTLNVKIFKSVSSTEDNTPKKIAFSKKITNITITQHPISSTQSSLSPSRCNSTMSLQVTTMKQGTWNATED